MKNEVLYFSLKLYEFDVVFCGDSEYIYYLMIQARFYEEKEEIHVKYQEMAYYQI